jgi:hypothetical protein
VIRVGLRFNRRDARKLRTLGNQVRSGELDNRHAVLFDNAANAAKTGEPLIVECRDKAEALLMADGFPLYGVMRPVIDELAGFIAPN